MRYALAALGFILLIMSVFYGCLWLGDIIWQAIS